MRSSHGIYAFAEINVSFLDIEIKKGFNGEPLVSVKGAFLQLLSQKKARNIKISLSWEPDTVVAFAVMQ